MASKQRILSIPMNFLLTKLMMSLYIRGYVSHLQEKDIYSITADGITLIQTSTSSSLTKFCSLFLAFHMWKQFLLIFLNHFLNQKEILVFKNICQRITYFLKIIWGPDDVSCGWVRNKRQVLSSNVVLLFHLPKYPENSKLLHFTKIRSLQIVLCSRSGLKQNTV